MLGFYNKNKWLYSGSALTYLFDFKLTTKTHKNALNRRFVGDFLTKQTRFVTNIFYHEQAIDLELK